jgi:hypothetical protein
VLVQNEDVKRKCGAPVGDESNDILIASLLSSAQTRVLDRLGFVEAAEAGHVEYKSNQRNDRTYVTDLRPVANLVVQGRPEYIEEFTTLSATVDDPDNGVVSLLGADGFLLRAYYDNHRSVNGWDGLHYEWSTVKYTYDVAAVADAVSANDLATIKDAISSYAAWLVTRALAGGAARQQMGQIVQELADELEPEWVWLPLAKFLKRGDTGERAEWV